MNETIETLPYFDLNKLPRFPCEPGCIPKIFFEPLSFEEVRTTHLPGLIFVITTEGELIIQDDAHHEHPDLGQAKPVLAAGSIQLSVVNGNNIITKISNASGGYMLYNFMHGEGDFFEKTAHFPEFVESVFIKAGFLEAKNTFVHKVTLETADKVRAQYYDSFPDLKPSKLSQLVASIPNDIKIFLRNSGLDRWITPANTQLLRHERQARQSLHFNDPLATQQRKEAIFLADVRQNIVNEYANTYHDIDQIFYYVLTEGQERIDKAAPRLAPMLREQLNYLLKMPPSSAEIDLKQLLAIKEKLPFPALQDTMLIGTLHRNKLNASLVEPTLLDAVVQSQLNTRNIISANPEYIMIDERVQGAALSKHDIDRGLRQTIQEAFSPASFDQISTLSTVQKALIYDHGIGTIMLTLGEIDWLYPSMSANTNALLKQWLELKTQAVMKAYAPLLHFLSIEPQLSKSIHNQAHLFIRDLRQLCALESANSIVQQLSHACISKKAAIVFGANHCEPFTRWGVPITYQETVDELNYSKRLILDVDNTEFDRSTVLSIQNTFDESLDRKLRRFLQESRDIGRYKKNYDATIQLQEQARLASVFSANELKSIDQHKPICWDAASNRFVYNDHIEKFIPGVNIDRLNRKIYVYDHVDEFVIKDKLQQLINTAGFIVKTITLDNINQPILNYHFECYPAQIYNQKGRLRKISFLDRLTPEKLRHSIKTENGCRRFESAHFREYWANNLDRSIVTVHELAEIIQKAQEQFGELGELYRLSMLDSKSGINGFSNKQTVHSLDGHRYDIVSKSLQLADAASRELAHIQQLLTEYEITSLGSVIFRTTSKEPKQSIKTLACAEGILKNPKISATITEQVSHPKLPKKISQQPRLSGHNGGQNPQTNPSITEQIKVLGARRAEIDTRLHGRVEPLTTEERNALQREHVLVTDEIKRLRQPENERLALNDTKYHTAAKLPIGIRAMICIAEGVVIGLGGEAVGQGAKKIAELFHASNKQTEIAYHTGAVGGASIIALTRLGLGPGMLIVAVVEGFHHAADFMDQHEATTTWGKLTQAPVQIVRDLMATVISPATGAINGVFQTPLELVNTDITAHLYMSDDGLSHASAELTKAMLQQIIQSIGETFQGSVDALKKHILKLGNAILELNLPSLISSACADDSLKPTLFTCRKDRSKHTYKTPKYMTLSSLIKEKVSGEFLYIIDQQNNLLIADEKSLSTNTLGSYIPISHIDLAKGKHVLAAGKIKMSNGLVTEMNTNAPDYNPRGTHLKQLIDDACSKQGVQIANPRKSIGHRQETSSPSNAIKPAETIKAPIHNISSSFFVPQNFSNANYPTATLNPVHFETHKAHFNRAVSQVDTKKSSSSQAPTTQPLLEANTLQNRTASTFNVSGSSLQNGSLFKATASTEHSNTGKCLVIEISPHGGGHYYEDCNK